MTPLMAVIAAHMPKPQRVTEPLCEQSLADFREHQTFDVLVEGFRVGRAHALLPDIEFCVKAEMKRRGDYNEAATAHFVYERLRCRARYFHGGGVQ